MFKNMRIPCRRQAGYLFKNKMLSLIIVLLSIFLLPVFSYCQEILSRAVVVMDASTGRLLYAKNPDLRCPPASTTKLMTAIVALERANLNDVVTISKNASRVPPHKAGFRAGDRITVEELLNAALIGSANDAAVALAEAVAGSEEKFVELMNMKALSIGASNTFFINATGLPGSGQYITANDLSRIMSYALKYPKIREIIGTRITQVSSTNGNSKLIRNTNRLLWSEDDLVGGKTGYTNKARHCFVCAAERKNDTIVVAILGSPSREELWRETESLITKGFDVLNNRENPVFYVTNTEIDDYSIVKPSKRTYKLKKSKKFSKKTLIAKKSRNKSSKEKIYAKKKAKKYNIAKSKTNKKKNYKFTKRTGVEKS